MKNSKSSKSKTTPRAPKRDIAALRRRRLRGIALLAQGKTKAQTARLLKVSRQSVGRWEQQKEQGGYLALQGAGRLGRKPLPATNAGNPAPAPSRRDLKAMRRRRHRAIELLTRGKTKAQTARLLGVSDQSVGHWARLYARGGRKALKGSKPGRTPKLGARALKQLEKQLLKGPLAHGFANSLWTLARVREVLERASGVRLHRGHVWRVLRALGWSSQRPRARARERNDKAIGKWIKHSWRAIKKKPAPKSAG